MKKPEFSCNDLFNLMQQAKKDWMQISHPLRGMKRNFTEGEVLAMSYFMASLSILNQMLPDEHISEKISVVFEELNSESIFD